MEQPFKRQRSLLRSRRWPALTSWPSRRAVPGGFPHFATGLVIALALVVLAGAIVGAVLRLRHKIREEIAHHDGEVLYAVSRMQQFADESSGDLDASLADPASQFTHVLTISRLAGVIGIRLFAPDGKFINAFPAYISEVPLAPADLPTLRALQPVSHYLPAAQLGQFDLLSLDDRAPVPLLVVNIPLHPSDRSRLLGVAQFVIEGSSIARAFAALDRSLFVQATLIFLAGGGLLSLGLVLAFRRLERANRLLAERTASLLRANQELALAARTSAVGAVTAHLIHGLKNPLSGLQSLVNNHLDGTCADWQEAIATTRRMQTQINDVVRILGEQRAGVEYELSLAELAEVITAKAAPAAADAGVHFTAILDAHATLSNREADLIVLVLDNLIRNALQATPRGRSVRLHLTRAEDGVAFDVADEGPGLPPAVRERLFTPCRSTKEGGSGIGLAISRQLAAHLGGTLELHRDSARGCVFRLTVPLQVAGEPGAVLTAAGCARSA